MPRARHAAAVLIMLIGMAWAGPSQALDKVRISAFQGAFVNLPVYVAQAYKLFEKHGIEAELIYGTGIQVTNIMVGGSSDFGAFAVEHGITIIGKNQDVRLLVVNQTLPPYGLIVRNEVPTPNADKPYPEMLKDMKGLKLGITTIGAATDLTLRYLLHQVGIEPSDVKIIPAGAPGAQLAGLKNGMIDGALSGEPTQSEAIYRLKIAKMILDIQGGQGPEVFRDYAYNGVWTTGAYLKKYPERAHAVVDAIVDAETMINDPARTDDIVKVASDNMQGFDPEILRNFIVKYRAIYNPIATPKQIENVEAYLQGAEMLSAPIPYDKIVAADFMPRNFTPPVGK
jgi:NitT/TauT family transport system substrate-binding protein